MKEITIHLYQYEELDERAKRRALYEARMDAVSNMRPEDFVSGDPEFDTPEELENQCELEKEYYEREDEPVIEYINDNGYWFFHDGTMADTYYMRHITIFGEYCPVRDIIHYAESVKKEGERLA